ncbi:MAG TPA: cupin domain-containing protein [Solirubrobacter sp.]|jgi:quercetin dioxygenase-like cupin family protein|nr:cupin domain-containing protein [Solirubrobacter sp.]
MHTDRTSSLQAVQTDELELMTFTQAGDPDNAVAAAWPIYRDTGAASVASVYFELAPGMHLPRHRDSAEEVLVVLAGEIEAVIGDERALLAAGGLAVVPSMVPHEAVNIGAGSARVVGLFSSNTIVSIFEDDFEQTGGRVVGTPPPA